MKGEKIPELSQEKRTFGKYPKAKETEGKQIIYIQTDDVTIDQRGQPAFYLYQNIFIEKKNKNDY